MKGIRIERWTRIARNDTTATVYGVDLGNLGRDRRRGKGKTIEIIFRSSNKKVGQMEISKSAVRWHGPHKAKAIEAKVEKLDAIFKLAEEHGLTR